MINCRRVPCSQLGVPTRGDDDARLGTFTGHYAKQLAHEMRAIHRWRLIAASSAGPYWLSDG